MTAPQEGEPASDTVQVATTMAASPDRVYSLVADLARMGEWSPETTGITWLGGAKEALPGARFRGSNRNGLRRWNTICTVVTAEPGRELTWESRLFGRPVALWRYRFESDGSGGTKVTETTVDQRGTVFRALGGVASGVSDRKTHNAESMRVTLERLKAAAERPPGTGT
jgi:uncharacterized protein YndB with AHSA1/START domain